MPLPSTRFGRHAVAAFALVIVISAGLLYHNFFAVEPPQWKGLTEKLTEQKTHAKFHPARPSRMEFIAKAHDTDVSGPFNGTAIRALCANTTWVPDRVFTCDKSRGGIGNVRNMILSCVRYAIEAGAGLVVPQIVLRDGDNIAVLETEVYQPLGHFFDEEWFVESLHSSCPQMNLYDRIDMGAEEDSDTDESPPKGEIRTTVKLRNRKRDISDDKEAYTKVIPLSPKALFVGYQHYRINGHPETWRQTLEGWIAQQTPPAEGNSSATNSESDIIIDIHGVEPIPLFDWPVNYDPQPFVDSFGQILRIREDIRNLAAAALYELSETFDLNLDPAEAPMKDAFFGAHLRTEGDAVGWISWDTQTDYYLESAGWAGLSILYVASGQPEHVAKFREKATKKRHFAVVQKTELLSDHERWYLGTLSWDQQALVDYLIMEKASKFAGIAQSSFAWQIAFSRHLKSQMKGNDHLRLDGALMLGDELSQIVGLLPTLDFFHYSVWP